MEGPDMADRLTWGPRRGPQTPQRSERHGTAAALLDQARGVSRNGDGHAHAGGHAIEDRGLIVKIEPQAAPVRDDQRHRTRGEHTNALADVLGDDDADAPLQALKTEPFRRRMILTDEQYPSHPLLVLLDPYGCPHPGHGETTQRRCHPRSVQIASVSGARSLRPRAQRPTRRTRARATETRRG